MQSNILTPEQQTLRDIITGSIENVHRCEQIISRVRKICKHVVAENKKELSAVCMICDTYFGWYCKKSPDRCCHYYTSVDPNGKRGIKLIDNTWIYEILNPFPNDDTETIISLSDPNYNDDWESEDCCLFCYEPDERK